MPILDGIQQKVIIVNQTADPDEHVYLHACANQCILKSMLKAWVQAVTVR